MMNDLNLTPDDPRLTAYALGELEPDERAAVETAVRRDPALLRIVEEIRAASAQMEAALAAEPDSDSVNAAARASTMRDPESDGYRRTKRGPVGRLFQFPQIYYVVGGLAAACFAAVAIWRGPAPVPLHRASSTEPMYVRVPINFAPEPKAETDAATSVSVPLAKTEATA